MRKLRHGHIVEYQNLYIDTVGVNTQMSVNVVMEYFPQGDLEILWKKLAKRKRSLSYDKILNYMIQLTSATVYLHDKQIIHSKERTFLLFVND